MFPYGRTKIKRNRAERNQGRKAKRDRQTNGTTASFPLSGPLPSLRCGRPVKADAIRLK